MNFTFNTTSTYTYMYTIVHCTVQCTLQYVLYIIVKYNNGNVPNFVLINVDAPGQACTMYNVLVHRGWI